MQPRQHVRGGHHATVGPHQQHVHAVGHHVQKLPQQVMHPLVRLLGAVGLGRQRAGHVELRAQLRQQKVEFLNLVPHQQGLGLGNIDRPGLHRHHRLLAVVQQMQNHPGHHQHHNQAVQGQRDSVRGTGQPAHPPPQGLAHHGIALMVL